MRLIHLAIIVLVVILLKDWYCSKEGLVKKPTDELREQYITAVLDNQALFNNGTLANAKQTLPWIDIITYEDIRLLKNNNRLNRNTLANVFK